MDNYDSFTYNLVHLLEHIQGYKVDVFRNDEIDLEQVGRYQKILLSPGPGIPSEAIGEAFGGALINLTNVYHGIATGINIVDDLVDSSRQNDWYLGLENTINVGRYHSWVVDTQDFPAALEVTSFDEKNMIMSLRHRNYDVQGVQLRQMVNR